MKMMIDHFGKLVKVVTFLCRPKEELHSCESET